MRQPASWARDLCCQPRRLALGLRPRGRRPENVFIRSDKGAPCFHPAPGPAEARAAGDGRTGSRTGPCVRPGWEGPILHPAVDGPPVMAHGQTAWGRCAWLRKYPGAGRQAWNRRGEESSTGGLGWSGPDPVWVQGRGGREGVSPSAGTSRPPTPGGLLGSAASLSRGETLHRATEPRLCPATLPASRLQTSPRAHSGGRLRSGSWLLSQSGPRLALRLVISRPTPQRSRGLAWAGRKRGWLHKRVENSTH